MKLNISRTISRSRRGFTLIEIMVVVVVLGILAAVIIPNFVGKTDEAMVSRARTDVSSIVSMVNAFQLDMHRLPTQDEGLDILRNAPSGDDANLWKGPYSQRAIGNDPWGTPYQYFAPAPNDIDPFGVSSYGRDKAPGGEGLDKDICSWENADGSGTDQSGQGGS